MKSPNIIPVLAYFSHFASHSLFRIAPDHDASFRHFLCPAVCRRARSGKKRFQRFVGNDDGRIYKACDSYCTPKCGKAHQACSA